MKNKKNTRLFEGFVFYLKKCWKYNPKYILYCIFNKIWLTFSSIVMILFPKWILDEVFQNKNFDKTLTVTIIYVSFIVISNIVSNIFDVKILTNKLKTFKLFQLDFSNRISKVKFSLLEKDSFREVKNQAEIFAFGSGNGFGYVLELGFNIFEKAMKIFSYFAIIANIDYRGIFIVLITIVITSIITFHYNKINTNMNLKKVRHERYSAYFNILLTNPKYGKDIRGNNISDWIINKYDVQLNQINDFYKKFSVNNSKQSVINNILNASQLFLLYWILIKLSRKESISIGNFSLFLSTALSLSENLKSIADSIIEIYQFNIYFEPFKKYCELTEQVKKNINLSVQEPYKISFQNLYFKYPGQNNFILKDINLDIKSGEKILLVGKNGVGKSTLIKLLLKIYEPTSGFIKINGININDIDNDEFARIITCIFQDSQLFNFSIRENIALSDKDNEDLIKKSLNLAGIDYLLNLPSSIDTNLNREFDDTGYIPSGGEVQKLSLARAIYKNSSIIILDEPTAAYDVESEFNFLKNIDQIFFRKTCLFVSHRLYHAKYFERIILLEDGRIVEDGSHEELMRNHGRYYKMYSLIDGKEVKEVKDEV